MLNEDKIIEQTAEEWNPESTWRRINSFITGVFVVYVLAVFPILYHNHYFDILIFKYQAYYVSALILAALVLINTLVFLYRSRKWSGENRIRNIFSGISCKKMRLVDWALFAFVIAAAISTFQSDYFYESFWGNEGRLCGLFLILIYGISYFIVTNCLRFKRIYLDLFLGAGIIVCFIGILHYFKIDPLGFKIGLSEGDSKIFSSTIGNINTYTSYIALVIGVAAVLFCDEKKMKRKLFYCLAVVVALLGMITGISDNAYLTLMGLFGLLPLYLFVNIRGVKHYTMLLATLITEIQVIGWINQMIPEHVIGIDGLFQFITGFKGTPFIAAFLWIVTIILQLVETDKKKKNIVLKNTNTGRWFWISFIVIVCVIAAYVLYDVNILKNVEKYGSLRSYLLFDEDWGTHRGYIWGLALNIFHDFPLHHQLFGSGPDTFGIITVTEHMTEMYGKYYEKYDSVHNEYIQYLVTIGIVGLISYLTFLGSAVLHMIRNAKRNPVLMAVMFGSLCYMIQATVNISVPLVAPIMMTLIMVGVSKKDEIIE